MKEFFDLIEFAESSMGRIVKAVETMAKREPEVITVKPDLDIKIPEQRAAIINVPKMEPANVTVNPEITVNVPEINVPTPHVVIERHSSKRWEFTMVYDKQYGELEKIIAERIE